MEWQCPSQGQTDNKKQSGNLPLTGILVYFASHDQPVGHQLNIALSINHLLRWTWKQAEIDRAVGRPWCTRRMILGLGKKDRPSQDRPMGEILKLPNGQFVLDPSPSLVMCHLKILTK